MSENTVQHEEKSGWLAWSTRDILLTAAIGVVFGLILAAIPYPYTLLLALGPLFQWGMIVFYFLPSFFIAYIIRRSGAALLIALLSNLVMLPFSPWGPILLIGALLYGIATEVGVAITTRYRTFSLLSMVLAGALSGFLEIILYRMIYPDSLNYEWAIVLGIFVVVVLGSALIAVIAKLLADAVARTGALSGTALKNEDMQEV